MSELLLKLERVAGGMDRLTARFDDHRQLSQQQHAENVDRLLSIEEKVDYTNGRVTRAEKDIEAIHKYGPRGALTMARVKEFGAFAGWLVAGILGLLKLLGKL